MIKIKVKKVSANATLPQYQTADSAGMDLHACINEPIVLKPMDRALVPCGISLEIPSGYEVQIRGRSGLALKNGVSLANGVGTIDADYRGEIGVILINLGNKDFIVNNSDRIAQMIACKVIKMNILEVNVLRHSQRGDGGFGSTGK